MTHPVIKETQALILVGEISEAESRLVSIAEEEGDHALVAVLDEMAPKDVLAVMREFDASRESIINLVVTPEQFVAAIMLERKYGEPIEKYVPRLRNTMNAVMHRSAATCAEVLECLAEHDEGVRLLADYFTDYYENIQNLAYHGVFEYEVDLEKALAPKRVSTWDAEQRDELDEGLEIGDAIEMSRVRMSRSEVADSDWMETAWVLRHEFEDTFELLVIEIKDRMRRAAEAEHAPLPAESAEPGVPKLSDDEESAI
ncbi:hypothetical protein J5J83_05820 [Azoarcus sp. L1K30]|uniref:hypothetical protein n=1 Tax=Azoarcus sp. L1K30 TaxID=2820277 RepID=UPI001B83FA12|nr:hypothetical protein [Azoarcus sp. L1K30]MBR0565634.1 hypothetical protein [Azoarcus sp. L1K30]